MAKSTKRGQKFISKEIGQLMNRGPSKGPLKGQKFTHKRAVAAALSVAREKGYKIGRSSSKEDTSVFGEPITESTSHSLFDEFITTGVDESGSSTDEMLARVSVLAEGLIELRNSIVSK